MRAFVALARAAIRLYQLSLRVVLGPRCRFVPSCSEYVDEALAQYGLFRGGWMGVKRLCRCRPGGGSGYDPVSPPSRSHTTLS
ncbi:MAG: membrane protein insertion efficiency factor YidD [Betaproteobacteria bacterium]|nr:membrane protein insertion efficiency factor YidD [Betaproteobacteria bacterium]NBT75007.1 membrane protein insertion efficiency factor YidD [Betaproteobacteria bacterium]NBY14293.1 membrane protein insertion efficiency factor YidD [Betaproteobacteria bacterium]NCA16002.1 membrane protein insertion efficiency factor YidD [Betaproteobacteria bacterium]